MRKCYSSETEYGSADELFKAVISLDKKRVEQLKAQGVTLTENVKNTLLHGGGNVSDKPDSAFWWQFLDDLWHFNAEDFIYVARILREETGAPLYYSNAVDNTIGDFFYIPGVFKCLVECFDLKRLKKFALARNVMPKDPVLTEEYEKLGWIKNIKIRRSNYG